MKKWQKTRKKNKKDNPVLNERKVNESFDIRKERIGIIFKVIYVVAALFLASVLALQSDQETIISTEYILKSCAASFLLCLLVVLLIYVFNELQCIKMTENIEEKQANKTEDSYAEIFNYFSVGGVTAVLSAFLIEYAKEYLTKEILSWLLCIFFFVGMAIRIAGSFINRYEKARHSVNSVVWTLAVYALILLTKFR